MSTYPPPTEIPATFNASNWPTNTSLAATLGDYVTIATGQTVTGIKTFANGLLAPSISNSAFTGLIPSGAGSNGTFLTSATGMDLASNQTVTGTKTFSTAPVISQINNGTFVGTVPNSSASNGTFVTTGSLSFATTVTFTAPGNTTVSTGTFWVNPTGTSLGSVADAFFTVLKDPGIASSGTITNAHTLFIQGAPSISSGGGSITNTYSLNVGSGLAYFQGNLITNQIKSTPSANLLTLPSPSSPDTIALLGDINSGANLPSGSRVLYVAANGSDANVGSYTKPKLTIAGAMAAVTAPTTTNRWLIQVGPGDYASTVALKEFVFIAGVGILSRFTAGVVSVDATWDTNGGNSGFYNTQFVSATITLTFSNNAVSHLFSIRQCSNLAATITVTSASSADSVTFEACTMPNAITLSGTTTNVKDCRIRNAFTCDTSNAINSTNIFSSVNVEASTGTLTISSSGSNTNTTQLGSVSFRSSVNTLTVVGNSGNTSILYDYLPAVAQQSFSGSPVLTQDSDIVTIDQTQTISGSKTFSSALIESATTYSTSSSTGAIQSAGGIGCTNLFNSGAFTQSLSSGFTGIGFNSAATVVDSAGAGTIANLAFNSFRSPTISSTNARTTNNPVTCYIEGAPVKGSNETFSNIYGLYVGNAVATSATVGIAASLAIQGAPNTTSASSPFALWVAADLSSLDGQLRLGANITPSVTVPNIYFNNDTTSGLYQTAANQIGVTISGSQVLNTTSTGLKINVAGSAGTPSLNFSDSNTGLYRSAANQVAVSSNGTQSANFISTEVTLPVGVRIGSSTIGTKYTAKQYGTFSHTSDILTMGNSSETVNYPQTFASAPTNMLVTVISSNSFNDWIIASASGFSTTGFTLKLANPSVGTATQPITVSYEAWY